MGISGRPEVVVPNLCTVLQLSDRDRAHYGFMLSDILNRDDYLKALCDVRHFATQGVFPPQNDAAEVPIAFHNPFFGLEEQSTTAAVTLLGHPGIGMQQCLTHMWFISI